MNPARQSRVLFVLAAAIFGCALGVTSASATSSAPMSKHITIGVLNPDPSVSGDAYARSSIQALDIALAKLGRQHFTVKIVNSVPYTQVATQTALQLFHRGAAVIYDIMSAGQLFYSACQQVPTKACIEDFGPTGVTWPAKNTINFAYDEPALYYLEGVAAGKLTKNGKTGFVSAFKAGYQIANINAFALGCQSVHPNCSVRNVYINSYLDPPKEVEAAKTLLSAGIDVLNHGMDDISAIKTAAASKVWVFGDYNNDSNSVPNQWVTGTNYVSAYSKILTSQLRKVMNGTFTGNPKRIYASPKWPDDTLQPWGKNVPATVKSAVAAVITKMHNGWNPFTGPIYDVSGKLRVPKGKGFAPHSDYVYGGWNWAVKGVSGA